MIEHSHSPEHIMVCVVSDTGGVLGAGFVSLRACREIRVVEGGRIVGWYIAHIDIPVSMPGMAQGLVFILPDGIRVECALEDVGVTGSRVRPGLGVVLEDLRVIHPMSRPIVVR